MRVLTIDIGNTAVKGSVFENGILIESILVEDLDARPFFPFIDRYRPGGAICCSVGRDPGAFLDEIGECVVKPVMRLSHETPLPIGVEYATPSTLGLDRIAAAAGASLVAEEALVVDAGTAVTLDIVVRNRFLGGNISPGMRLRFRSLNRFTSRLPLVSATGDIPTFGYDTETAIRAGVVNGIVSEIVSAYKEARKRYPRIRLLLTGGDADFLAPHICRYGVKPVTAYSLVGKGLERIYLHAEKTDSLRTAADINSDNNNAKYKSLQSDI